MLDSTFLGKRDSTTLSEFTEGSCHSFHSSFEGRPAINEILPANTFNHFV